MDRWVVRDLAETEWWKGVVGEMRLNREVGWFWKRMAGLLVKEEWRRQGRREIFGDISQVEYGPRMKKTKKSRIPPELFLRAAVSPKPFKRDCFD